MIKFTDLKNFDFLTPPEPPQDFETFISRWKNYFFLPKCSSSEEKSIGERIMHFGAPGDELRPFENRVFHAFSGVSKIELYPHLNIHRI